MKLTIDFSGIEKARESIGAELAQVYLNKSVLSSKDIIQIETEKGESVYEHVTKGPGGLLIHSGTGEQITLHISEPHCDKQSLNIVTDYIEERGRFDKKASGKSPKFHIADCKTLEKKRDDDSFHRYFITNKCDGYFKVRPKDFETKIWGNPINARLAPCDNCLKLINYKKYQSLNWDEKQKVKLEFKLSDFFSENKSVFRDLSIHKSMDADDCPYTEDWPEISRRFRESKNWSCECCGCNASDHRELLHTHHIDGNKKNNRNTNLRALCIICHQKQPHHSGMPVKAEERLNVQKIRRLKDLPRKCLSCGS